MGRIVEETLYSLASLAVFRGVLDDPAVSAFRRMLEGEALSAIERIDRYGAFMCKLLKAGGNWSEYLLGRLLRDENPYVLSIAGALCATGKNPMGENSRRGTENAENSGDQYEA